jgi:hypothetical protein
MVFGDFRGVKLKRRNVIWEHANFVKKEGYGVHLAPYFITKRGQDGSTTKSNYFIHLGCSP